jgi:hypothetical protein
MGGMSLRTILAGLAIASVLTGCGSSGDKNAGGTSSASVTGGASSSLDLATAWRQFAQCVRKHGAPNYPDPVQRPDGKWGPPPGTDRPPMAANDACRESGQKIKNLNRHRESTAADMAKLRQFARCMRQHGVPTWPDPQPDGSFRLPPPLRQKKPNESASRACGRSMQGLPLRLSSGNG